MRFIRLSLVLLPLAAPVFGADKLSFGPVPAWVTDDPIPAAPADAGGAPLQLLRIDLESRVDRGLVESYSARSFRIASSTGLTAGVVGVNWDPTHETPTVHRVLIHRAGKTIDLLAAGQKFDIIRRETNLDHSMVDGRLTAILHPEGLQVGDVVDIAISTVRRETALANQISDALVMPAMLPLERGEIRLNLPDTAGVRVRASKDMPRAEESRTKDGRRVYRWTFDHAAAFTPPRGAPNRFGIARVVEVSGYHDWAALAARFKPLYDKAATIPASGPLRVEADRIRGLGSAKARVEAALALVQDRIRYTAMLLGDGGYMPTEAATTWQLRYGDCKAKTALLIGLLRHAGIEAEPVLVSSAGADGIDARLPLPQLFDHVLVRTRVDGATYFLDGTRSGDTDLSRLTVPMLDWGLPLIANASLIRLMPPPPAAPLSEMVIHTDLRDGGAKPAPTVIDQVARGDGAIFLHTQLNVLAPQQRDEVLRNMARAVVDNLEIGKTSSTFDEASGELRLHFEGTAPINPDRGFYWTEVPTPGFDADYTRTDGQDRDAPYRVNYPQNALTRQVIDLPDEMARLVRESPAIDETIAGVRYQRTARMEDGRFVVELRSRSLVPEVSYAEAHAAQERLRKLDDEYVGLQLISPGRVFTVADALRKLGSEVPGVDLERKPSTAQDYVGRAHIFWMKGDKAKALAEVAQAIRIDPKYALAYDLRAQLTVGSDHATALADVAKARSLGSTSPDLDAVEGWAAAQTADFRAAITAFTRALARAPKRPDFLMARAEALMQAGDLAGALVDADAAVAIAPEMIHLYVIRANIYTKQGLPELVAKQAELVAKAAAKESEAHVSAAKIYDSLGDRKKAFAEFDRALAIEPSAFVYVNRAQSREPSDKTGRLADITAAAKSKEIEGDLLVAMVEMAADLDQPALYDRLVQRAELELPDDLGLRHHSAMALARAGKQAEARAKFASLRDAAADNSEQLNGFCWSKALDNVMLDEALKDCDAALARHTSSDYFDSRALVLFRLGRLDEALAAYDRALGMERSAASLFGRAMVLSKKGDRPASDTDAAAALKLSAGIEDWYRGHGLTR